MVSELEIKDAAGRTDPAAQRHRLDPAAAPRAARPGGGHRRPHGRAAAGRCSPPTASTTAWSWRRRSRVGAGEETTLTARRSTRTPGRAAPSAASACSATTDAAAGRARSRAPAITKEIVEIAAKDPRRSGRRRSRRRLTSFYRRVAPELAPRPRARCAPRSCARPTLVPEHPAVAGHDHAGAGAGAHPAARQLARRVGRGRGAGRPALPAPARDGRTAGDAARPRALADLAPTTRSPRASS